VLCQSIVAAVPEIAKAEKDRVGQGVCGDLEALQFPSGGFAGNSVGHLGLLLVGFGIGNINDWL
jgi:hypothetical protein